MTSTESAKRDETPRDDAESTDAEGDSKASREGRVAKEIGGRKGPDPTRYGDWEKAGRCIDF